MSETTTIQVSRETRDKLLALKPYPRATVEDVIIMLINEHDLASSGIDQTKQKPEGEGTSQITSPCSSPPSSEKEG